MRIWYYVFVSWWSRITVGWLLAFFGVWCVLEVIADGLRTYASECRNSCAIWIPASYALSLRRPRELEMQVASSRIGPFFGEGTQHTCLAAQISTMYPKGCIAGRLVQGTSPCNFDRMDSISRFPADLPMRSIKCHRQRMSRSGSIIALPAA